MKAKKIFSLFLAMVTLLGVVAVLPASAGTSTPTPIVAFDFSENATKDTTGTYNANVSGNAKIENGVARSNAVSGNTNHINFNNKMLTSVSNEFSVSLLMMFHAVPASGNQQVYRLWNGTKEVILLSLNNAGKLNVRYGSDNTTTKTATSPVTADKWYLVTMAFAEADGMISMNFTVTDVDAGTTETVTGEYENKGVSLNMNNLTTLHHLGRSLDTSFRQVLFYNQKVTGAVDTPDLPEPPAPTPDPSEEPDPDRVIADHLVMHFNFEGATDEEKLSDKATAGNDKDKLLLYTSIDENGVKQSYLENNTAFVSSKQFNYLLTIPGQDIKGLQKSMTTFMVFQPTWERLTNPCDVFYMHNNRIRFALHNSNQKFFSSATRSGESWQATVNDSTVVENGNWVYAAVTQIYDADTKKISNQIRISLDKGETWSASPAAIGTNVTDMYAEVEYLLFGKIGVGMDDRGASFRFKDIRVYDCALTEAELQSIDGIADYIAFTPPTVEAKPVDTTPVPVPVNPSHAVIKDYEAPDTNPETAAPETDANAPAESDTNAPAESDTAPASTEKKGCEAVTGFGTVALLGICAGGAVLRKRRRAH